MPEKIPVGSEQEQPTEPERPEWLPEKFKSPEELAKSYGELENRLRESSEDRNNLNAQLEDLYGRVQTMETHQQQAPQAGYDPSRDPIILAYEQAMENGDYRSALAIQAGLTQQYVQQAQPAQQQAEPKDYDTWAFVAEQTAIQTVGGLDEWAKYKDAVASEAKQESFDGLSAQQAGVKLARIYKMVKADDVLNNQQTVAEQRAEAERAAKLSAQSTTGSSVRMPEPTKDEAAVSAILKAAKENSYESLIRGS